MVKVAGKCIPLYIEYIIKEYKGKQRCGAKGKCGKECSSFQYIDIVYNSIIEIRKRKRWGKGMFIIYRYIEQSFL